jgi:hypothetical protein
MTTIQSPVITYLGKNGFTSSQYPNIEFVIDKTIDDLDLNKTFEFLFNEIPDYIAEYLPNKSDNKKIIRSKSQSFQFDDFHVLLNLKSKDIDIAFEFNRLRSIHCESQYFKDGEYDLIYIFSINNQVGVEYQLIRDDLSFEDVDDETSCNLVALFYTFNSINNTVQFNNAELVLFESHENNNFEGKLLFDPEVLIY